MLFPVNAQWSRYKTNHTKLIDNISIVNDDVMWITDETGTKFSITKDGGKTWQQKSFPIMMSNYVIGGLKAINDSVAYVVVCEGFSLCGVFKTTDGGNNWTQQTNMFTKSGSYPNFVCFWNENEGVAVGDVVTNYFEIYSTRDGGKTWKVVPDSLMPYAKGDYTYNRNKFYTRHGDAMYFVTGKGRIMRTLDKGKSWKILNTPLTSGEGMHIEFRDVANGIVVNQTKQYCTTDSGKTWIPMSLPNMYSQIKYFENNNLFVSTGLAGLSYSMDNGTHWLIAPQLKNINVGMAASTPSGKIIVGGTGYIYMSNDCSGINLSTVSMTLTSNNSIDVLFNKDLNISSAENSTNYNVYNYQISKANNTNYKRNLTIKSVKQDATNKALVHIETQESFPLDTIRITVSKVTDTGNYGFMDPDANIEMWSVFNETKNVLAGNLSNLFTLDEQHSLLKLKLKGTIDARDFKTIRDNMKHLNDIDLSETDIVSYEGVGGTRNEDIMSYAANSIPNRAFYDSDNLRKVTLPATTTALDGASFYSCSNIRQLILPSGVISIGGYSFFDCVSLDSISIPTGLKRIENNTFENCSNLKLSQLPDSISYIGASAFSDCSSFRKMIIPSGVKEIGEYAFESTGVDTVIIQGRLKQLAPYTFDNCTKLRDIKLPSTLKSLGSYSFYNCYNLKNITLPDSIVSINSWAFHGSSLDSIVLPQMLESIGDEAFSYIDPLYKVRLGNRVKILGNNAFSYNYKLQEFIMPNSVKRVGSNLFDNCIRLTTIVLSDSLENIGGKMFNACSSLKELPKLPASLKSIDGSALSNCIQIKELIIPATVTSIGNDAFKACVNLEKLILPPSIQSIPSGMVEQCGKLKELVIPPTVNYIGSWAFSNCRSLTELKIPNQVTGIGDYAFSNCSGLNALIVGNPKPVNLTFMSSTFNGINFDQCSLYVPYGSKSNYVATNYWYNFKNIVESGTLLEITPDNVVLSNKPNDETVLHIRSNSFWKVSADQPWVTFNKTEGHLDDSVVVSISKNDNLTERVSTISFVADSVIMYSVITQAGSQKTIECTAGNLKNILSESELASLTNIKLIGEIDARDFRTMRDKMPQLSVLNLAETNIKLYSGYEGTNNDVYSEYNTTYQANTIPQYAFRRKGLNSIVVPKSVLAIGNYGFQGCSDLVEVDLPEGLKVIGDVAFNNCASLKSVTVPNSVTSLGTSAFSTCKNLRDVKLPENISIIGAKMFFNCNLLHKITIPDAVTTIESEAFYFCRGLKEIVLNTKLQYIYSCAFLNCDSLSSITLPASLKKIDVSAFRNCTAIKSIYSYIQNPKAVSVDLSSFEGIDKNTCYLYIPAGTLNLYKSISPWRYFLQQAEMITETPGLKNTNLIVMPNPFTGIITVKGFTETAQIKLFNMDGKLLIEKYIISGESVMLHEIPNGAYLLKVISLNGVSVQKVIKNN